MREINKIGVFIRNGLTSAEIKKKVKDTLRKQQVHINLNLQEITQFCYNNKK